MPLLRRIAGRALAGAAVLLAVMLAVFGLLAAQPGDAASRLDDPRIPPQVRTAMRQQLALDQPWPARLVGHVRGAVRGDLGWSVARAQPVTDALGRAIGPSLTLGGVGLATGLLLGFVVGTWQGYRTGTGVDRWLSRLSLVLVAIPDFWLALLLMTLGARVTGVFPVGGWPRDGDVGEALRHLVLPALAIALLVAARVARYQRTSVASTRHEGWARAARGRGIGAAGVRWRHVARAAAAPTIALTGLLVPMVIAGTVFVEVVFAWPGVGRLLLDAVQARDVPLAIGATLATAAAAVAGSTLADVLHAWLDPRVADR